MFAPSKKGSTVSSVCRTPFIGGTFFAGKPQIKCYGVPKPGEYRQVVALKARIMQKPQFLGASVINVRRGAIVKVDKVSGSWSFVTYRGRKGWIHNNRIQKKSIRLSSGGTGSGTSRGEMEIGGRG